MLMIQIRRDHATFCSNFLLFFIRRQFHCVAPAFSRFVRLFFRVSARFRPARTHRSRAQPEADESVVPLPACLSSQMVRLIHRLALQAAPMK